METYTFEEKKVLFLSSLGGVLEFYDFIIYIFLTNILEKNFFQSNSEFVATLKTLAIFSIGYLLRPFGGIVFSHFGDRYGRKVIFMLTILFMGIPSFAISLLPTENQIGIAAPILLLLFRMMQGLALGGEIPGAITFVAEHVKDNQRGFSTATLFFGINMGLLLGSLVTTIMTVLMSSENMNAYGWRIPFFIGGVLGMLALFLRRYLKETDAFKALRQKDIKAIPLVTLLETSWRKVIVGTMLVSLASVTVFLFLYWPHYLNQYLAIPMADALTINTYGTLILSFSIIVCGILADRVGYQKVYAMGAILIILLSYFLFNLFLYKNTALIILSYTFFAIIFGFITGAYPAMLTFLFETSTRYTGIATCYNLSFALFGGLSPLILTFAIYQFHAILVPAYYLICVAIFSLIACILYRPLHK